MSSIQGNKLDSIKMLANLNISYVAMAGSCSKRYYSQAHSEKSSTYYLDIMTYHLAFTSRMDQDLLCKAIQSNIELDCAFYKPKVPELKKRT